MQPGFCTYEELKDYISSTKSQILGSWEYRRLLDVRYILQRLTIRRSISFLRQNARAQKARKSGLSGLLASFPYINFALLIGQIYVFFRVLNDGFHRGKKTGLMHIVAQGGGGKRRPFCRRMEVKAFPAHTHDMQESQDNAAAYTSGSAMAQIPSAGLKPSDANKVSSCLCHTETLVFISRKQSSMPRLAEHIKGAGIRQPCLPETVIAETVFPEALNRKLLR